MRTAAILLGLLLVPLSVDAGNPLPFDENPLDAGLRSFDDLSSEEWQLIERGYGMRAAQEELNQTIDHDLRPLGDVNEDGRMDLLQIRYDETMEYKAISGTGATIWTYAEADDFWFLAVGDADDDGILDFAVLDPEADAEGYYSYEVLNGRDLSPLASLKLMGETYEFFGFSFTTIPWPSAHPTEPGFLLFESSWTSEGDSVFDLGIASYGHEGETRTLSIEHVTISGSPVWDLEFDDPYVYHSLRGYWDHGNDGGHDMLMVAYHDPDEDHLEVNGERPLDEEPEETLTISSIDLSNGQVSTIASWKGERPSIGGLSDAEDPMGRGQTLLLEEYQFNFVYDGNTFQPDFWSRLTLLGADGTTYAELEFPQELVFASVVGDQDGDGRGELWTYNFETEESQLRTNGFDVVWTDSTDESWPMFVDLDGDGFMEGSSFEETSNGDIISTYSLFTREPLWNMLLNESIIDMDIVNDVDGIGEGDLVAVRFPGDLKANLSTRDGHIEMMRGQDGARFWSRHVYEANDGDFPRIYTRIMGVPDINGDGAPDLLVDFEFIPRSSYSCDVNGCVETREAGELYSLAAPFNGITGHRLLTGIEASENFEGQKLDGPVEGKAAKDLQETYGAPAPALLLVLAALAGLVARRRH